MGTADYRLLVVSSRARNKVAIFNSVLPNLVLVDYNYETTTLDELVQKIRKSLSGTKVVSVAMVLHTSERELFICGPGPAFVSLKALISDPSMKAFLLEIAKNVLDLVRRFYAGLSTRVPYTKVTTHSVEIHNKKYKFL